MLNKNGFSSKEFIAVIVIIGMFVCVMVPMLLNAISGSDIRVMTNNVITFRSEVDREILSYVNGGEYINDGCYYVTRDGNICLGSYDGTLDNCLGEELEIMLDGLKPKGGYIDIVSSTVSDIHNIEISNLFVNINSDDEYYATYEPKTVAVCR